MKSVSHRDGGTCMALQAEVETRITLRWKVVRTSEQYEE